MNSNAKICRGSWCMAFGFDPPASLEQVANVLSAFGYDGIEVGGFFDHATVERYPDKASREKLRKWLTDDLGLEIAGIAPGPYGDLFRLPWATGSQEVYDEYIRYFESYLQLAADMEIPGMRVDPGAAGPLPYDADYNEVWDRVVRTFQHHAAKGAEVGCVMLWELESLQPFNKPSETVKLLQDVGHDNFKLMYDTGHFQACSVIGHNHVQPAETLPNQIDFIRMLPEDSIGHIHLCDTDMNTCLNMFGTKSNFGEGIIDFEQLMPVLADAYNGEWWAVDSIPMGSKAWQDTWDGLPFLNDLLDRHVRKPAGVAA
jgi:sugar phosphate isomerase/epimerase